MSRGYDVVIIGGGPSGMMAASKVAETHSSVLLLEKNDKLGIKLLMTGKGRCNLTNAEPDLKTFASSFNNPRFLLPALYEFGPKEMVEFLKKRGMETKVERGMRVFPKSNRGQDVLDLLLKDLKEKKVEIRLGASVKELIVENDVVKIIVLQDGVKIDVKKLIIATGGMARPNTGSSGDAYAWLEKMGHTIVAPRAALTPILVKEDWIEDLEGLSLKNVAVEAYQRNRKKLSRFGEAVFTSQGLSGPVIIDMSRDVGALLERGDVSLKIDLKPALEFRNLDRRVRRDFSERSGKMFKNSLNDLLPSKIIPTIVRLSEIDPDKKVGEITKKERLRLVHLLKGLEFVVNGVDGFDKAIVTAGGVSTREVDRHTMRSRIISNLYLCGEVLDIDGPTGGYNLQACWSTGFVAGSLKG